MSNLDPEAVIDTALDHEERAVVALEAIADALTMYAKIEAQRFEKEYPSKGEPQDATITHIKTPEDIARENLGDDGSETTEEWTDIERIGPRERALFSKKTK